MVSIEKRVVAAILRMTGAGRELTACPQDGFGARPSAPAPPVRLREALFSDFSAVTQLQRSCCLGPHLFENWERLWRRNPALGQLQLKRPIGWVLEAEGRLVGYLGNISLLYRYGDRALTAVTGCGFAVEPAYRAMSLCLVAAFHRQRFVDLYLATTAGETVGRMVRAFKSDPLPQPDYKTTLVWVLQPYPFVQAVVRKLNLKPAVSHVADMIGSMAVGADKILRRRWPPRRYPTRFAVNEVAISDIGDDFQALWVEKLKERPRLLADRSPASLRWHFEIPPDGGTVHVLCCYMDGELVGYAVINDRSQVNHLRTSVVVDVLARQDDPAILAALWSAAYDHAKQVESDILEVLGFPHSVREVISQWKPYLIKFSETTVYYRAADPMLHKTLSDGMAWYATPFDGDATLS
jgi:hypothetical protein